VISLPLVHVWDVGLTDKQKVTIQKGIADAYKEANPMLKVHEELLWVVFHEVSSESWMVGPLTVTQLRQKLRAEKK
jgi:phenylpyruvate tautomerase PptA (4-oxalocrotonate tautomerase family)